MPLRVAEADDRAVGHAVPPTLVALVLLLTIITPSMALMQGAGSMALGVFAVSLGHIFIMLALPWRDASWGGTNRSIRFLSSVFAMLLASGGISLMIYAESDANRLLGSLFLFITFGIACISMARSANFLSERSFVWAVRAVFYILILAGVMGALHISPFSSIHLKAVLFFVEPSHYALSLLPFLLFMTLSARPQRRIIWVVVGLAMALSVENLSLMTGALIVALIVLEMRYLLLFSPFALIAAIFISLDYYASRLDFSETSTNFSALVFLGGWERAYLAFRDTHGIGLGFQQFGVHGDQGTFSKIILRLLGSRLNVLDGGTVGAKFVGEFGAVGVLLVLVYLIAFIRTALWVRRMDTTRIDKRDLFFLCCFLMFSVDIFVRGVAYFSASGQLFLASLLWLLYRRAELFGTTGATARSPRRLTPQPPHPMPRGASVAR